MIPDIHEILDETLIAFDTEKISEDRLRNAVVSALHSVVSDELGSGHELVAILDPDNENRDILADLAEYNNWETANRRCEA